MNSILTRNFRSSLSEIKLKVQPVTKWSRVTDWGLYLTTVHRKKTQDSLLAALRYHRNKNGSMALNGIAQDYFTSPLSGSQTPGNDDGKMTECNVWR